MVTNASAISPQGLIGDVEKCEALMPEKIMQSNEYRDIISFLTKFTFAQPELVTIIFHL